VKKSSLSQIKLLTTYNTKTKTTTKKIYIQTKLYQMKPKSVSGHFMPSCQWIGPILQLPGPHWTHSHRFVQQLLSWWMKY